MNTKQLIKKYKVEKGGIFDCKSFQIDLFLEAITLVEVSGSFAVDIDSFYYILNSLIDDYEDIRKAIPQADRDVWKSFVSDFYERRLRDCIFERNNVRDSWINKIEPNDSQDFCLYILDENPDVLKEKYMKDTNCFDILNCELQNEMAILDSFAYMVDNSDKDIASLTLAKNQALFIANMGVNKPKSLIEESVKFKGSTNWKPEKKVSSMEDKKPESNAPALYEDPQIKDIKTMLIDNMKKVASGQLTVEQANAVNSTVQTFINMSKTQLEYMKFLNSK